MSEVRTRRSPLKEFKKKLEKKQKQSKVWSFAINAAWALLLCVWVAAVLYASQFLVALIFNLVLKDNPVALESTVTQLVYAAVVYLLCLALTIFVPWKILTCKTTRDELGLRDLPTWTDILLAPAGFIVFMIVAAFVTTLMAALLPAVDWEQAQDVGFTSLITNVDFVCAFFALVVIAPIAEEIIFRGWLYGKLRAKLPAIPAMLLVSVLFGIVHGQWNVGVTVFVMSIAMCTVREITGTIWGGILIHIIKNGLAFYLLFVNPAMI